MSFLFKKESKAQDIKSGLYIVSTPIGNLEDITIRAINILKKSNYILCEDTRVSSTLLRKYNINSNLISNHKFNEKNNLERVMNYLKKDLIVSMISDAGTPVISDPGQLLIKECIKNKIKIFPIPGPSAVTSAMSISGFNDKYLFFGFLPNSEGQIEKELEKLRQFPYTIIFWVLFFLMIKIKLSPRTPKLTLFKIQICIFKEYLICFNLQKNPYCLLAVKLF